MKVKSLGTGLNSRMKGKQQKEKRKANELEDRIKEITPIWRGKNGWKNKHSLRGLCDYKKISNICVIRTQEGMIKEGRKKHWKKRWLSIALKGFVNLCVCVCVCVNCQSCSTLWDPMDCSPPSSSIHGILQARILEWVALLQGIFPTQR